MARFRWIPGALIAWVAFAILLALLSVPPMDAAGLSAAVVAQALAGMVIWGAVVRATRTDPRDRLELVGMGVALGVALAVVCGVLVDFVLPGWPGWLLPVIVAAGLWFRPKARVPEPGSWVWRRGSSVASAVGVLVGLIGIRVSLAEYPLTWTGAWSGYHRDMLFFEALSTSVARYGPADSIFMSTAQIRYHWFGYAWAGQLAETFNTMPFVTLTRVLPVTALFAVMTLVASWSARRRTGWTVPVLAVLLVATGGYLGAINGTILNFDSPSESISAAWLVALLIAFLAAMEARATWMPLLLAVAFLGAVNAGGKISAGAVALGSMAVVAIVLAVRRDDRARRAWLLLLAAAVGVGLAFVLLIAGTATGGTLQVLSVRARAAYVQGLVLDKNPLGIAAGTASLLLAMGARWLGVLWLAGARSSRWTIETLLGVGLIVSSTIPVLVLSEGVSETWFGLAASAPLAVLSAVGVGAAWAHVRSRAALALSLVAVPLVLTVVTFLWAQGAPTSASARFWGPVVAYALALGLGAAIAWIVRTGVSRAAVWMACSVTILVLAGAASRTIPIVADVMPRITYLTGPIGNIGTDVVMPSGEGILVAPPTKLDQVGLPPDRTAWTPVFAEAADHLFEVTDPSDIVVTNDSTSFLVPALGRRLTYISGSPYQWMYGSSGRVEEIPERVRVSEAFVNDADPAAFAQLCRAGVTWLWASHDLTDRRDWQPYATVEFTNDEVSLARLDRTRCP